MYFEEVTVCNFALGINTYYSIGTFLIRLKNITLQSHNKKHR